MVAVGMRYQASRIFVQAEVKGLLQAREGKAALYENAGCPIVHGIEIAGAGGGI
jgi:hypothetical protein